MRLTKKQKYVIMILRFLLVWFIVASIVTIGILLFVATMDIDVDLTKSSPISFLNVLFISFIISAIDLYRQRKYVEKPIDKITNSLDKIKQGDFEERLNNVKMPFGVSQFNPIIDDINLLAEELSGVETFRTDFISNVSHELKTPISVISNYATLLQSPDLAEEQRIEYASAITATSKRLADMISNILKINKLENQQIFPNTKRFSLSEQLCECLLQFEQQWEEKNINIETDIDEDIFINSDEELLSIVWNNLFSNAMKFTESGETVTVKLKADNGIKVTVADTGCGMSEQTRKHIFDKFYQGDTSHSAQGNGLGLALVKRIMDIIGGTITVDSVEGQGSAFEVMLDEKTV